MEIKFRVFCGGDMWYPEDASRNGALEDWYLTPDGRLCELTSTYDGAEVEWYPEPRAFVMFWTGLKDRNGRDVYAGDILEFDEKEWYNHRFESGPRKPTDRRWPVEWDDYGSWETGGGTNRECGEWKTVIGNIYENPELLEEDEDDH